MNDMTTNETISPNAARQQSMLGLARFYFDLANEHSHKKRFFLSKALETLDNAQQGSLEIARNYYLQWATLLNADPTCSQERDECLRKCNHILDTFRVKEYIDEYPFVDDFSFDPFEVGRYCQDLGETYFKVGSLDDALCCLDYALSLFYSCEVMNVDEISRSHCRMAQIYLQQAAFEGTKTHLVNIVMMSRHITPEHITLFDEFTSMDFDRNKHRKEYERSTGRIIFHLQIRVLRSKESLDLGHVHCMLGLVYWKLGNMNDSADHTEKAIRILEAHPQGSQGLWRSHHIMAQIMLERQAIDDALSHFQLAKEVAESTRCMLGLASTYREMGLMFHNHGGSDQALSFIKRSIAIQERHCASDRVLKLSESYKLLGLVFEGKGKYLQAVLCYQRGIENSTELAKMELDSCHRLGLSAALARS